MVSGSARGFFFFWMYKYDRSGNWISVLIVSACLRLRFFVCPCFAAISRYHSMMTDQQAHIATLVNLIRATLACEQFAAICLGRSLRLQSGWEENNELKPKIKRHEGSSMLSSTNVSSWNSIEIKGWSRAGHVLDRADNQPSLEVIQMLMKEHTLKDSRVSLWHLRLCSTCAGRGKNRLTFGRGNWRSLGEGSILHWTCASWWWWLWLAQAIICHSNLTYMILHQFLAN